MAVPAPFDAYRDVVRPEWIDHNQHMNMGYYLVVFDYATDAWFDHIGLTTAYRRAENVTTFSLEGHITYHQEVREGAPLRFTTRLIDFDEKRIHYFHEMHHGDEGYLAATNELMTLHVSEESRRAAPMGRSILDKLCAIKRAHDRLPMPPQVGRVIGLSARPAS